MPKGLKSTSSIIQISGEITESAADTFTSRRIDLQLNPLDNEVFVVLSVNLDLTAPDLVTDRATTTNFSLSSTERTSVGSLANSNVIAHKRMQIQDVGGTAVAVDEHIAGETPSALLDYVYIIATDDFFANVIGNNNNAAKKGIFRMYGYRAKADAATYAALVQSEVLSS
tara:strand:+ start:1117 stop:1626 length:510 start_codon:yes stop_codon:yes gene_type:complete